MLSVLLLSLILFSGSIIAYSFLKKKTLMAVPLTAMAIAVFLFVFGLFGQLFIGTIVLNVVVLTIYVICFIRVFKSSERFCRIKDLGKGFFIVFAFVAIICCLDYGMMAHEWDEFSHWADVVKAMFSLDDLATNPLSMSMFKDYPPGMALLQYLFQEENVLFRGMKVFDEWRLYAVYHIVVLSLLFPVFEKKSVNKIEALSISVISVSLCCFYYSYYFERLYIDQAVASVAVYVLCMILFFAQKDRIYDLSITFGCVFLVLLKDIGLMFAVIAGVAYLLDKIRRTGFSRNCFWSVVPLSASVLTKCIWRWKLFIEGIVPHFQNQVNISEYLRMLIFKNGNDYKQDVVNNSVNALWNRAFHVGPFYVSYFMILIVLAVVAIFSACMIYRQNKEDRSRFVISSVIISIPIVTLIFSLFIGAIYAYRFSEYEAVRLASYDRYMNICFLFSTLVVIFAFCHSLNKTKNKTVYVVVLAFVILLSVDNLGITNFISRNNIKKGILFHEKYNAILDAINLHCDENDIICVLSRGDNGEDVLAMKYYLRPVLTDSTMGYNLGGPYYEGDVWNTEISPEEFMNGLISRNISYVAIIQEGSDFAENYGVLFENSDEIEDNSLFAVDIDSRQLVRCY